MKSKAIQQKREAKLRKKDPVETITLIEDTAKGAEKRKGSNERGIGLEKRGRGEAAATATR